MRMHQACTGAWNRQPSGQRRSSAALHPQSKLQQPHAVQFRVVSDNPDWHLNQLSLLDCTLTRASTGSTATTTAFVPSHAVTLH